MKERTLIPNIQLFAQSSGTDEEEQRQEETNQQKAGGAEASDLPQTQEELDALIERRIKREQKKWAKTQGAAAQPTVQQEQHADQEQGATQQAAQQAQAQIGADMQRELTEAKAQLAAVRAGFRADIVEDAVYLAIREIEKNGDEPDADTISEALKQVIKRHPSWKNEEKTTTGIKVGAGDVLEEKRQKGPGPFSGKTIF